MHIVGVEIDRICYPTSVTEFPSSAPVKSRCLYPTAHPRRGCKGQRISFFHHSPFPSIHSTIETAISLPQTSSPHHKRFPCYRSRRLPGSIDLLFKKLLRYRIRLSTTFFFPMASRERLCRRSLSTFCWAYPLL